METSISIGDVISGIDVYGKELTGKIIGTSLSHAIVKSGEDRLDVTTISFENIKSDKK